MLPRPPPFLSPFLKTSSYWLRCWAESTGSIGVLCAVQFLLNTKMCALFSPNILRSFPFGFALPTHFNTYFVDFSLIVAISSPARYPHLHRTTLRTARPRRPSQGRARALVERRQRHKGSPGPIPLVCLPRENPRALSLLVCDCVRRSFGFRACAVLAV